METEYVIIPQDLICVSVTLDILVMALIAQVRITFSESNIGLYGQGSSSKVVVVKLYLYKLTSSILATLILNMLACNHLLRPSRSEFTAVLTSCSVLPAPVKCVSSGNNRASV